MLPCAVLLANWSGGGAGGAFEKPAMGSSSRIQLGWLQKETI
jgi:hypothetical protein